MLSHGQKENIHLYSRTPFFGTRFFAKNCISDGEIRGFMSFPRQNNSYFSKNSIKIEKSQMESITIAAKPKTDIIDKKKLCLGPNFIT